MSEIERQKRHSGAYVHAGLGWNRRSPTTDWRSPQKPQQTYEMTVSKTVPGWTTISVNKRASG